jgi:hypothetical protein
LDLTTGACYEYKHKVLIKDGLHDYLRTWDKIKDAEIDNTVAMKEAFTSEYDCSVCMKD